MKKRDYLVWSILATLFCCLPFGIVGIVYSVMANSAYDAGNYEEHVKKADSAKTWTIWSVILGLVVMAIYVAVGVASVALENSGTY